MATPRPPAIDRWIGIWLPFVDAYEAGLWLFWVTKTEIVACPRPALQIVNDRLHCADGPAVAWPAGAAFYFWHGVQVPEAVILRPESITPEQITAETNAEVRRVLLTRFGEGRYLDAIGALPVHADDTGTLYRADLPDDEPLVMVRVLNSTPELDGSIKPYWLRVPPTMRTARQAVAWTFGLTARSYRPLVET